MRWRVILVLSLLANLILALGWFGAKRASRAQGDALAGSTNTINTTNTRNAVIVRRQFFSWQELESQDYPTYIKNLRSIGCPEQTIRDIIIADVTQMLREKYPADKLETKPKLKWWTNHQSPAELDEEAQNATKLWTEREAILTQLLGPDWATRPRSTAAVTNAPASRILATLESDPVFQSLPADKKQLVAGLLSNRSRAEQMYAAARFTTIDATAYNPAEVMAAEKERWSRLAELLSPEQLEAAKLYFSLPAGELRDELDALPGFNTQPEEFRKIFRNTEAIEAQMAALVGREDEASQKQSAALMALRDAAIRNSLAPERYEMYVRLSDPAYLAALDALGEGRATPDNIRFLYALNREKSAEQERIENDPTLTETQREIELLRLELDLLKAVAVARGEELRDEAGQKEKSKPEPMKTHSALAGESLDRIAFAYGVTPAQLRALNPNVNFDKLAAGTPINIPLYPLPPPPQ